MLIGPFTELRNSQEKSHAIVTGLYQHDEGWQPGLVWIAVRHIHECSRVIRRIRLGDRIGHQSITTLSLCRAGHPHTPCPSVASGHPHHILTAIQQQYNSNTSGSLSLRFSDTVFCNSCGFISYMTAIQKYPKMLPASGEKEQRGHPKQRMASICLFLMEVHDCS